jgi:hypothetical protein
MVRRMALQLLKRESTSPGGLPSVASARAGIRPTWSRSWQPDSLDAPALPLLERQESVRREANNHTARVRLGHIGGIPITLPSSWSRIFLLVTWSLAAGYFPAEYPTLSKSVAWLLGVLCVLCRNRVVSTL